MTENILFKNGNHNVGLKNVLRIRSLGPVSDVKTFFECVDMYIDPSKLSYPINLISDKLYKRSVKLEELDNAVVVMHEIEGQFEKIKTKDVDWEQTSYIADDNDLDLSADNLKILFGYFSKAIEGTIEARDVCLDDDDYKRSDFSVRLICSDLPFGAIDVDVTDEQFDALKDDAEPIWARVKYIGKDMDDHIKRIEKRSENFARKLKEKQE